MKNLPSFLLDNISRRHFIKDPKKLVDYAVKKGWVKRPPIEHPGVIKLEGKQLPPNLEGMVG